MNKSGMKKHLEKREILWNILFFTSQWLN